MQRTRYLPAAAVVTAMALILVWAVPVAAQVPTVTVYFDKALTQDSQDCQGIGTIDTLYVTAAGLGDFITAIEFSVDYSSVTAFTWLGDMASTPLVIGSSPTGIALTWQIPQSVFTPLVVVQSTIIWNCNDCSGFEAQLLKVVPHPQTGHIRMVRYPDRTFVDAIGLTSAVCTVFPVETSTWGALKALYEP